MVLPTIQGQTKFVPVDQDQDDDIKNFGLEDTQCSEKRKYATVNTKNDSQREKKVFRLLAFFYTHDLEPLKKGVGQKAAYLAVWNRTSRREPLAKREKMC